MTKSEIESRLVELEKQVNELRAELRNGAAPKNGWRSTFGMFAGDEMAKRIDEFALRLRERDRARACKKHRAKRKSKTAT